MALKVPKLGRAKESGKRDNGAVAVNVRMTKAVGFDEINDERELRQAETGPQCGRIARQACGCARGEGR